MKYRVKALGAMDDRPRYYRNYESMLKRIGDLRAYGHSSMVTINQNGWKSSGNSLFFFKALPLP